MAERIIRGYLLFLSAALFLMSCSPSATPAAATQAVSTLVTRLPFPTKTTLPSQTPTLTPTLSPTLTYTAIVSFTPVPYPTKITDPLGAEMVLVPAGEFTMGSEQGGVEEKPAHKVYLDTYYIDLYEVTNKQYKACVDVEMCQPPISMGSNTRSSYFGNSQYNNYPVIFVTWEMSKAFCEWRGATLPTEAQWEKAARGTDGRTYPWGEDEADCSRANFINLNIGNCAESDTTAVGSYESGKSPYGIYDMAGNVWEWIADWYADDYYKGAPSVNPVGPESGQHHQSRGGAWLGLRNHLYTYTRHASLDEYPSGYTDAGFRCVRSIP